MAERATASAPASSANLGPGFDTIALALALRCVVVAEPADEWSVAHVGPEPYVGDPADDAVLDAARRVCDRPLALEVDNPIPLSRGVGSSAAAYTAGALAAMRAQGDDPDHDALFEVVRDLEGHPDNAAAAVHGGLVAVAGGEVVRLSLHEDLVPVLAIPRQVLRTRDARRVLPEAHTLDTISRTLGRYTALLEGLRTGKSDLLALAAGDELHEAPRAALNPIVGDLMSAARRAGAGHVCWSGAGPSVLAITNRGTHEAVAGAMERALGDEGHVLIAQADAEGAR